MEWLVLQLADSAFPTGGFAHSGGLEAAAQLGEVASAEDLATYLDAALWQAGHASLPFVGAAHDAPAQVAQVDAACDAFLTNHVANRASRTQGRAFAATAACVLERPALRALDEACRARAVHAHLAPVFGAALSTLDVSRERAQALFLYTTLRALTSAAVRLGLSGPHEAQRAIAARAGVMDRVLSACAALSVHDAAQTAPLLDLFGMAHDRLYSRLFQS